MGYDLGALVPLGVDVRDAAGVLTNADSLALTITLPDGTPSTPAIANPPAVTGRYVYDYPSTQRGRHVARWLGGGPATAYAEVFYVRPAEPLALVSLRDIKLHLNLSLDDTTYDEELVDASETATEVIEGYVGAMARRTITAEKHSGTGGPALVLRHSPVMSITTVTENGVTVDADGYSLSPDSGVLYRVAGYVDSAWPRGRHNIAATYVAGAPGQVIPASVIDAEKELVRINFRPQLGGNYSPFDGGGSDNFGAPVAPSSGALRYGFFVPNVVVRSLEPHGRGPVIG